MADIKANVPGSSEIASEQNTTPVPFGVSVFGQTQGHESTNLPLSPLLVDNLRLQSLSLSGDSGVRKASNKPFSYKTYPKLPSIKTDRFLPSDQPDLFRHPQVSLGWHSLLKEPGKMLLTCYECPQKIEQVQRVGPAENCWDGHRILDIICWLCKWLNIPKLGPRNGLCELDEYYKCKSCTGTVPRSIQCPGGESEVSGSPCLRSQEETTGSVDRKGQYDNADWFNENPNRAGGTAAVRTDNSCAILFIYKGNLDQGLGSQQPASSES